MIIGCCTNVGKYKEIEALGYDAISLAGKDIAAMSDEDYAEALKTIKDGKLKFSSVNAAFPPTVKLNGAGYDLKQIEEYTEKLCKRMQEMGAKYMGIGSPKSRTVAEGEDFDAAMKQFEDALKLICSVADKYGICACLEACCDLETNFINTTEQALAVVEKMNIKNLFIVYDIYHAYMMKEDIQPIGKAYKYITGVHISKPDSGKRYYPDEECMAMYKPYIDELKKCGYDGELATEAFDGDFSEGVQRSIALLKKL